MCRFLPLRDGGWVGFIARETVFDYREVTRQSDPELFAWRDKFNKICKDFNVKPAAVFFRRNQLELSIEKMWKLPLAGFLQFQSKTSSCICWLSFGTGLTDGSDPSLVGAMIH
jgi:hypothetical protein